MGVFSRQSKSGATVQDLSDGSGNGLPNEHQEREPSETTAVGYDDAKLKFVTPRALGMAAIVSLGGMIFGFDIGQISGFLDMQDFLERFAEYDSSTGTYAFSNVRSGTIVGLLSIGTLVGALCAAPLADWLGRRLSIAFWCAEFIVGVIVQITTSYNWVQIAVGRLVAGFGVGALSVLTPMYMSETSPRQIRGALVSCYQLFITFGIFLAYCINYATHNQLSPSSWRTTMGVGFIWPAIMGVGIFFLPESPRWEQRHGKGDSAQRTISLMYGVSESHPEVQREVRDMKAKLEAENAGGGKHPWYEAFTGPRMRYRILLGMVLQALQQLSGANYFFYYGTSVFADVGISDSYVTSIILGLLDFVFVIPGLFLVERTGRRKTLIYGALWMGVMFILFASIGHVYLRPGLPPNKGAGSAMIVFACLFVVGYAMSWGPLVWVSVSEIYPSRYRATALACAVAANWTFNFLISFFTPFITADIDYLYGFVFAGSLLAGAAIVYFFVCEASGRTLEEIDTMYILHVTPWKSASWVAPVGEDLVDSDRLNLTPGGRGIRKDEEAGQGTKEHREHI